MTKSGDVFFPAFGGHFFALFLFFCFFFPPSAVFFIVPPSCGRLPTVLFIIIASFLHFSYSALFFSYFSAVSTDLLLFLLFSCCFVLLFCVLYRRFFLCSFVLVFAIFRRLFWGGFAPLLLPLKTDGQRS